MSLFWEIRNLLWDRDDGVSCCLSIYLLQVCIESYVTAYMCLSFPFTYASTAFEVSAVCYQTLLTEIGLPLYSIDVLYMFWWSLVASRIYSGVIWLLCRCVLRLIRSRQGNEKCSPDARSTRTEREATDPPMEG